MSNRPDWDDQFRETKEERNARLATRRAALSGMFHDHSCWKCLDGQSHAPAAIRASANIRTPGTIEP